MTPEPHEVFRHFPPWSGHAPKGFTFDFLGVRTRPTYGQQSTGDVGPPGRPALPRASEEYFQWIATLDAVLAAQHSFTMLELGAGWGCWLVRGAVAARRRRLRTRLVGVEAEPTHFRWMRQHCRDNGVRPWHARLVEAAVSSDDGGAWFLTGDPSAWYGQQIIAPDEVSRFARYHPRRVRAVSLTSLLRPLKRVDLIHMDVQGEEYRVLAPARTALVHRVRHVHIGTHGPAVEAALRRLFAEELGWTCVTDYAAGSTADTPYGTVAFDDGVQDWRNPAWRAASQHLGDLERPAHHDL